MPLFTYNNNDGKKKFVIVPLFSGIESGEGPIFEGRAYEKLWPIYYRDRELDRIEFLWPFGYYEEKGDLMNTFNIDLLYKRVRTGPVITQRFGPFGLLGKTESSESSKMARVPILFNYFKDEKTKVFSMLGPLIINSKRWEENQDKPVFQLKSLFPVATSEKQNIGKENETRWRVVWPLLLKYGKDAESKYIQPFFLYKFRYGKDK